MSVVDTNVLVHSSSVDSPRHHEARAALAQLATDGPIAVSRQILREFISATTRPNAWARAATLDEARANTDGFLRQFLILDDGPLVWDELMRLSRQFAFGGKQVHDANIVATMLANGERRLLTYNRADFLRFSSVIDIITP